MNKEIKTSKILTPKEALLLLAQGGELAQNNYVFSFKQGQFWTRSIFGSVEETAYHKDLHNFTIHSLPEEI